MNYGPLIADVTVEIQSNLILQSARVAAALGLKIANIATRCVNKLSE